MSAPRRACCHELGCSGGGAAAVNGRASRSKYGRYASHCLRDAEVCGPRPLWGMAGRATRHELAGLVGENAWARQAGRVRVAVLLLGGLSNFTDCDAYKMVDTLDQPWLCQSAAFFYPLQAVNFFLPRGLPRLKA